MATVLFIVGTLLADALGFAPTDDVTYLLLAGFFCLAFLYDVLYLIGLWRQ